MHKALYDKLMDNGVKLRLGIAELLGTASEIQSVSQVGVYRTLDLQRHSFGASQLLYLPVKRVVDIVLGTVGCLITLSVAAGTSLAVYPAAGLIDYFSGDHLAIINRTPTPRDAHADLCIATNVGKVLGY